MGTKTKTQLETELKEAQVQIARLESALRDAALREERYRLVADHAVDVIWVLDPIAGKFTYVSPSVEKLRGYTPEEVMAQPVNEALTPDSFKMVSESLQKNLPAFMAKGSGTESFINEVDQPCKDGSIVHTEVTTTYLFNNRGEVEIVGVSRDITVRKQTETALQESEERFRILFETMIQGVLFQDAQGRTVLANPAAQRILELNLGQLVGKGMADPKWVVIREDGSEYPMEERPTMVALRTGKPVIGAILGITNPAGEKRHWLSINAVPRFRPGETQPYQVYSTLEDITERKRLEQTRATLIERLDLATHSAHLGIWDWDIQKNEIVWDDKMYALYGLPPGRFGGAYEAWLNGVHPDDREPSDAVSMAAVRGEREYDTEFRVLWPDGSVHWLKANGQVFRDANGTPLRMVGVNYDITDRKRTETALQQSEQRYSALFEKSAVPAALTSMPTGVFVDVNEAFQSMYGYSREDVIGKTSLEIGMARPDERAQTFAAMENQRFLRDNEKHLFTKAGEVRIGSIHISRLKIDEQDFVITTIHDVTERKQMEKKLRESEEFLRMAYEAADLGIWKNDLVTGSVEFDERAHIHYGFDTLQTTIPELMSHIHPDDVARLGSEIAAVTSPTGNGKFSTEYRVIHPDGSVHWLAIGVRVIFEGEGEQRQSLMGYGTSLDITERKRAEEAIKKSEAQLKALVSSLDDIVFEVDERGTYLNVWTGNDALLVRPRAEIMGKRFDEVFGEAASRPFFEFLERTLNSNAPQTLEYPVEIAGSQRWFAAHYNIIHAQAEMPRSVSILVQEITERKRLEESLRESEQKYTLLFQKSTVPTILIKLPEVVVFDANEAYETLTGYTRQEMFGKTSVELGLFRAEQRKELVARFDREGELKSREGRLFSRDGKEHVVVMNTTPVEIGEKTFAITTMQDITERRQAEEKLRLLLDILPVGISVLDGNRNVAFQNNALLQILDVDVEGLGRGAYKNRQYLQADGSPMPADEFASVRAARNNETIYDVETGVRKENGETIWTSVSAVPVDLPDWKTVIVTADITERKRVQDAFLAQRRNLKALIENTDGSIWSVDSQYRLMVGNKLYHQNTSAALGHTFMDGESVLSPKFPQAALDEWRGYYDRALGGERFSVEIQTRFAKPVSYVEYRFNPIINHQGSIVGVTIFGRDTSDRKRAEDALQLSQENFARAFESNPAALAITRISDGNFINVNDSYTNIMGYSKAEIIGHTVTEFSIYVNSWEREQLLQYFAEHGRVENYELVVRAKNQEHLYILVSMEPILYDAENCILSTFIDVTGRKRIEQELRRSNAELEQFAYVASHDLQEPLRAVAGMVQLLQKRYQGQLDARADEYIAHAVEAAGRMQSLISDLLAYSRVDRHAKPIEPVNADDSLQAALKNLDVSIRESHAVITADALPTVHADSTQLTQLFQNLIGNGIKFRGEKEPLIHISATKLKDAWQFSVRDNGIGIESQYFERIFLVFQRLHTRREYSGTGIGLALCKKIVERHGGSIWVESRLNEGSTFHFILPIRSTNHD